MKIETRDLSVGAFCVGVMVAASVFVGPIHFQRVAAAVTNVSLETDLDPCTSASRSKPGVPDVYLAPTQGTDLLVAARLASHLSRTTELHVKVSPPMGNCIDCMDHARKQLAIEPLEERAAAFFPELIRHDRTVTIVITDSDLFSQSDPSRPFVFAARSLRKPVAVVSNARLGEDPERAHLRLYKLVTRQVAKKAMRCPVSDDPRSVLYSEAPRDLDDLDLMMLPDGV